MQHYNFYLQADKSPVQPCVVSATSSAHALQGVEFEQIHVNISGSYKEMYDAAAALWLEVKEAIDSCRETKLIEGPLARVSSACMFTDINRWEADLLISGLPLANCSQHVHDIDTCAASQLLQMILSSCENLGSTLLRTSA